MIQKEKKNTTSHVWQAKERRAVLKRLVSLDIDGTMRDLVSEEVDISPRMTIRGVFWPLYAYALIHIHTRT